jgi:hypothetical protein
VWRALRWWWLVRRAPGGCRQELEAGDMAVAVVADMVPVGLDGMSGQQEEKQPLEPIRSRLVCFGRTLEWEEVVGKPCLEQWTRIATACSGM